MLIVGAGGFAKQILPIIERLGLVNTVVFYDDYSNDKTSLISRNFRVLRSEKELAEYFTNADADGERSAHGAAARRMHHGAAQQGPCLPSQGGLCTTPCS